MPSSLRHLAHSLFEFLLLYSQHSYDHSALCNIALNLEFTIILCQTTMSWRKWGTPRHGHFGRGAQFERQISLSAQASGDGFDAENPEVVFLMMSDYKHELSGVVNATRHSMERRWNYVGFGVWSSISRDIIHLCLDPRFTVHSFPNFGVRGWSPREIFLGFLLANSFPNLVLG